MKKKIPLIKSFLCIADSDVFLKQVFKKKAKLLVQEDHFNLLEYKSCIKNCLEIKCLYVQTRQNKADRCTTLKRQFMSSY